MAISIAERVGQMLQQRETERAIQKSINKVVMLVFLAALGTCIVGALTYLQIGHLKDISHLTKSNGLLMMCIGAVAVPFAPGLTYLGLSRLAKPSSPSIPRPLAYDEATPAQLALAARARGQGKRTVVAAAGLPPAAQNEDPVEASLKAERAKIQATRDYYAAGLKEIEKEA